MQVAAETPGSWSTSRRSVLRSGGNLNQVISGQEVPGEGWDDVEAAGRDRGPSAAILRREGELVQALQQWCHHGDAELSTSAERK